MKKVYTEGIFLRVYFENMIVVGQRNVLKNFNVNLLFINEIIIKQ